MVTFPHLSGRFDRPRGWRRWLIVVLLAFITAAVGAYLFLASPSRVAKLAGDLLEGMAGTEVRVEAAKFGWDGTITLHGLSMRIKDLPGDEGRLFEAEQVLIKHHLLGLARGVFQAQSLTFINPVLHLTENPRANRFNFQVLQEQRQAQPLGKVLQRPPEIYVRNGTVKFGETDQDRFQDLGAVQVNGNLTLSPDDPGVYFFRLRQVVQGAGTQARLSGWLHLHDLSVSAKLERFVFGDAQRDMLPRALRLWWDQLQPVGTMSSVKFGYDPDPAIGLYADFEVQGVEITLPYGELDSRMTGVSGRFSIVNETVAIADLAGQIEGIQYVINGRLEGLSRDAAFQLSVRTDPFAIPEKPQYLFALPTTVQEQFRRFNPRGTFKVLVAVERREAGGPLVYEGTVRIAKANILYQGFKYPLESVRGELRFNDERIELTDLRGRGLSGAKVTVNGFIAPPKPGAAVHVVVTAQNAPVDDFLYKAIPEQYRDIIDLFINQPAYQRLLDRGLVQTSGQQTQRQEKLKQLQAQRESLRTENPDVPDALAEVDRQIEQELIAATVPVFDLGGTATVIAQSSRAYGPNNRFRMTIGLKAKGVRALLKSWPYPVRLVAGQLLIKPDEVVVDNIELEGLTGATGRIAGRVTLPPDDQGSAKPQLGVEMTAVPCDSLLFASVPEPHDQWLKDLHLAGFLDAVGEVGYSEQDGGGLDFCFLTDLKQGSVQPYGGQFKVDQVAGVAAIRRRGIEVRSVRGRHDNCRLELSARADWSGQAARMDLELGVKDLDLEPAVLDVFPPADPGAASLRQFYDAHKPSGVVDAKLKYHALQGRPADYRLGMEFKQLRFEQQGRPVALTDITGGFVVKPQGVELIRWGGAFETGRFLASGMFGFSPRLECDVKFDVRSEKIDPTTRAMLPKAVLSVVDGLALDGAYAIEGARLFYQEEAKNPGFRFSGKAKVTDASASIGVPLKGITGVLDIQASRQAGSEWPALDLRFEAEQLLAAERLASPVSLRITTADQPDRLAIKDLWGTCYGGTLLGSGEIQLGEQGFYRMNLVLQNVSLNPFIYPAQKASPRKTDDGADKTMEDFTGVLGASLAIEGSLENPASRRGRGEVEIRNANLYELPLAMAMMHILNLSFPSSKAFDRAYASYLFSDDSVMFETVRFEAPSIQIVGGGTMDYSSLALDLDLYTRNPGGPQLGALSDLFRVFKDELLTIHVGGTLAAPETQATSFQGIKRSWQEVFGSDQKPTHKPLPAARGTAQ